MTTATELTPELIEQVRKLSLRSREELFDLTEPEETDAAREAWRAELARRVEDYQNGTAISYSLEEVNAYVSDSVLKAREK